MSCGVNWLDIRFTSFKLLLLSMYGQGCFKKTPYLNGSWFYFVVVGSIIFVFFDICYHWGFMLSRNFVVLSVCVYCVNHRKVHYTTMNFDRSNLLQNRWVAQSLFLGLQTILRYHNIIRKRSFLYWQTPLDRQILIKSNLNLKFSLCILN